MDLLRFLGPLRRHIDGPPFGYPSRRVVRTYDWESQETIKLEIPVSSTHVRILNRLGKLYYLHIKPTLKKEKPNGH